MRAVIVSLLVVGAIASYLLFWPVPIDPVAWEPDPDPGHGGAFAPNRRLAAVQSVPVRGQTGPEHVTVGPSGFLYTGVESGAVIRIDPASGRAERWVSTGGRPLGMEFDASQNLVVADALRGLLSIAPDGTITELVSAVDGVKLRFTNDVGIAPDGRIFFTESSTRFGPADFSNAAEASLLDLLEHGATGRLLVYDPRTEDVATVFTGLSYANGVAVTEDGAWALVAETGGYRIWRVPIGDSSAGPAKPIVRGLPGFPDNITRGTDGRFWVALASPRNPLVDALAGRPFLRKVIARLPRFLRPGPAPHSHVIAIDSAGRIREDLQDPAAIYPNITGVTEAGEHLYLGSVWGTAIGRVARSSAGL